MTTLFEIDDLRVTRPGAALPVLDRFSLTLNPGETVVMLGDADSGKDIVLCFLDGLSARGEEFSGTVRYNDGEEKLALGTGLRQLALGPPRRRPRRDLELFPGYVGRRADVQAHGDVRAQAALDVGDELGREARRLTVVHGSERDAALVGRGDRVP